MMTVWQRKEAALLRSDVQLVLVFSDEDWTGEDPTANGLIITGARAFVADRQRERDKDGIITTPTLVGLDRGSRIRFISTGFDRQVNVEFINENLG